MLSLKKIDLYVSSIFWKIFAYTAISFLLINIIVDLFDRLKMFLDNHAAFYYYFYYYLIKSPYLLNFILPIATIFAAIVTMHRLIKNNEIIVMFNAGLSYVRIAIPVIISGFVISIGGFILSEIIIPGANYKVDEVEARIKKKAFVRKGDKDDFSYKGKKGLIYSISHYDNDLRQISGVLIEKWDHNAISYRADIAKATYADGYGWLCEQVYIKLFDEAEEELPVSVEQPIERIILKVSEVPGDFAKNVKKYDEMNFMELNRFINAGKKSGIDVKKFLVELYMKFSFPLISFLVTLLGLGITIINPRIDRKSVV